MSRGSSDYSKPEDKKPEPARVEAPKPVPEPEASPAPKPDPIKPDEAIAELALLVGMLADQVPGAHQIADRVAALRVRLA